MVKEINIPITIFFITVVIILWIIITFGILSTLLTSGQLKVDDKNTYFGMWTFGEGKKDIIESVLTYCDVTYIPNEICAYSRAVQGLTISAIILTVSAIILTVLAPVLFFVLKRKYGIKIPCILIILGGICHIVSAILWSVKVFNFFINFVRKNNLANVQYKYDTGFIMQCIAGGLAIVTGSTGLILNTKI
jgi:hypothetical protein